MNRKAKNGIKVLISLVITVTMIGIPASIFIGATPSMATGPDITIGDPKYEGEAPPIDYEGPVEDYTGPTYPAIWVTPTTPINISAWGVPNFVRLHYRVWNFTNGWGAEQQWSATNYTVITIGGSDRPGECLHKIEAWIEDIYGFSKHSKVYVYVDDSPPTTTKEYGEPWCINPLDPDVPCITNSTPIYINASDGEWNIENESCPVGVNGTWINITNMVTGDYTGWYFYNTSKITILLGDNTTYQYNATTWNLSNSDECLHNISYYSVDWFGHTEAVHWQHFYLDNTPPDINEVNVSAPWYENHVAKNLTGGSVNITVNVTSTGCCPNVTNLVQLEVDVINSSARDGITTIRVNMTNIPGTDWYYFNWHNGTIIDVDGKTHKNNTAENGLYKFRIYAYDCLGNENVTKGKFWIKPMCDVDIIELVTPDPSIWHPEMPTKVEAKIKNNGICDVEGPINVHLQIYEETPPHLEVYKLWDMESCIVSGMWEAYSWDNDQMTWYWTEKRANSPTHSWHSQPDSLDTYEAYSHDSLILSNNSNGIYIPKVYEDTQYLMNKSVVFAYLTFSHWCRGEFSAGVPVDYGKVYIRDWNETMHDWNNWTEIGGPYYHNGTDDGAFEDVKIDISEYIGKIVQFNWTWFADPTVNYEGWYIDDVNIDLSGSMQPLVYQEYKYVYGLAQNETKIVQFPLTFVPKEDTWYFFEVYSDLQCCGPCENWDGSIINCTGDIDGPKDMNYDNKTDGRTGYIYKDPWNGVNESLYFGDVCDAAILSIDAPSEVEMPDENKASIPITVEVYNNGTLTEDVPVKVTVQHKLTDIIFEDDMEGAIDEGWSTGLISGNVESEDLWEITDKEYFSPIHSWHLKPSDLGIGQAKRWGPIEKPYDIKGGLKMEANIKYNLPEHWDKDGYGAFPYLVARTYYWDFGGISTDANHQYDSMALDRVNPFQGSSGWVHFDADEFIQTHDLYWEERYGNADDYPQYVSFFNDQGGFDSFDDLLDFWHYRYEVEQGVESFDEVQIGFCVQEPDGLAEGQGFWFDDFKLYSEYGGDVVWQETKTVEDLEQGETATLNFTWNTTSYCDYLIKAEIALDCDVDPNNNEQQTTTRIYEQIYKDGVKVDPTYAPVEAEWWTEDNTCGGEDQWHIVKECSICPDDAFWWNGEDETGNYSSNRNDWLMINHTFNWTGMSEVYVNFSTFYAMEYDWDNDVVWDTAFLEISNDSGKTWFVIDQYINSSINNTWEDLSYLLVPNATLIKSFYNTGWGPYSDTPIEGLQFIMPLNFFTDKMQIRFRFYSDPYTNWKGMYIDDVELNAYNGTAWNVEFADDMEDMASSYENWTHGYICYGVHWHKEDAFATPYPGLDNYAFWNGDNRTWTVTGKTVVYTKPPWGTYPVDPKHLPEGWSWTNLAGDGVLDSYLIQYGFDFLGIDTQNPDTENKYLNLSNITLPDSPVIEVSLEAATWNGWGTGVNPGFWLEITDGTDTELHWIDTNWALAPGWLGWDTFTFDISNFSGKTVTFACHFNSTGLDYRLGYVGSFFDVTAYIPGAEPIPVQKYYNDVDEKLIYAFNLTNAYEAILTFNQNYSFADENDLGYVEIYSGGAWKPLLVNKGSSDWGQTQLDITKYVNHEGDTLIRFKFVSNETGQDYGWLVDNISIQGKVDNAGPEVVATLSPAEPDGNNDWYVSPVTVTLTATDDVKVDTIYYRIDGGVWLTYTAPVTINVDGQHTVDYYAVDTVGNEGEHGSVSFKIDLTAPTGSITTPQAGYIYLFGRELMPRIFVKDKALIIGGLTATATASDAMSGVDYVTFSTGAGSGEDAVSPYTFNLPFYFPFGSDTLSVSVTDNAGNTANDGSVAYFKIL